GVGPEYLGKIEIAFHEHGKSDLTDCSFRQVETVERAAFRVNGRFRRIQILRHLIGLHGTTTKSNDRSGVAANGDHQAVPEPVDYFAAVALENQAALQRDGQLESLFQQP